jgi:RNA-binding protein
MSITSNLSGSAKRALRAAAHHLDPVVMIGDKGLTSAVLHEIDIALSAHALIKVRVASDDREQRVAFMNDICAKLACESVQHLGKLLVLWRNKDDGDASALDDDDAGSEQPAATTRGPRRKLAESAARTGVGRAAPAAGGRSAPAGAGRGAPAGAGRSRTSGYAPRGDSAGREGGGYARSESGYGRGEGGGYARGGAAPAARAPAAGRMTGDAENRRFRRSDDAAPTDTRTPREGTAPRGRRGAGRFESTERAPDDRGNFDRRGGGSGAAGSAYGSGAAGDADRRGLAGRSSYGNSGAGSRGTGGGAGRGYGDSQGRASSGDARWGNRGAAGGAPAPRPRGGGSSGGAGMPAKPRARRRLG